MKIEQIYKMYLNKEYLKGVNKQFDFSIKENMPTKKFKEEFQKFVCYSNSFFTHNGLLLTSMNSCCYVLPEAMIQYINQLYLKSLKIENIGYRFYISEYLFNYYNAIKSEKYKNSVSDFEDAYINFKKHFNDKLFQKNGDIFKASICLYKNIVKYAIKNNIVISPELTHRIFTKFNFAYRNNAEYMYIFNKCIKQNKFLNILIEYDYSVKKHKKLYNDYILNNINTSFTGEYSINILKKLYTLQLLSVLTLKKFINEYIRFINSISDKSNEKNENIITMISEIDNLLKNLSEMKKISYLKKHSIYKNKINECIIRLLYYKRLILKDEEFTKRSLHEQSFEFEIPKTESSIKELIDNHIFNLYNYLKKDFDFDLETSIKIYSEHPLVHMISHFTIDNKNEIYIKPADSRDNFFKRYYDNEGRKFERKNKKKLLNFLSKDYYEVMMQYISQAHNMVIDIILLQFNNNFDNIIKKYREAFKYEDEIYNNSYIVMSKEIVSIERFIYDTCKDKNLKPTDTVTLNLEKLFRYYKKNKNYRNGFMLINFILYDNSGLRLRNRLMHGELTNNNNIREHISIISCALFIQYYLNMEKGVD